MTAHPLPPRKKRPLLVGLVFLASALSFWILAPTEPPSFEEKPSGAAVEGTEEGAPAREAGAGSGFARDPAGNGDKGLATAPPARAPKVSPQAAEDGVLRVLVLGDEQSAAWRNEAARVLQSRLQGSGGRWSGVKVSSSGRGRAGWTAAHALAFLEEGGWEVEQPELVLVALGWHDAVPGALPRVAASVDGSTNWLAELASLSVLRDLRGSAEHFYLREAVEGEGSARLAPLRHLEYLDSIGLGGAEHGAAVVYVEQPARFSLEQRRIFATTAMRPQPWISTVFGLEQQQAPEELFDDSSPIALSPRGAELLGRFVGVGLVPVVLGSGR
ncbi:MAG: hypothetical protein VX498_13135 [Myxococcota bacterium]|nr:hypothetical protein [Myxococcota bacterium]